MTEETDHAEEMAKIEGRKAAWQRSPFWYCFYTVLECVFWLGTFALLAQCSCKCILK